MMKLTDITHRDQFPKYLVETGRTTSGVEVGVFRGEYANVLLNGWPGTLTGVDCYNYGREFDILMDAIWRNEKFVREGRYKIIVADSEPTSHRVEGRLDFVYIDADHMYASVMQDLIAWFPKVRIGGILCGHDYRPGEQPGRAAPAVDDFVKANPGLKLHIAKECSSWFIEKP